MCRPRAVTGPLSGTGPACRRRPQTCRGACEPRPCPPCRGDRSWFEGRGMSSAHRGPRQHKRAGGLAMAASWPARAHLGERINDYPWRGDAGIVADMRARRADERLPPGMTSPSRTRRHADAVEALEGPKTRHFPHPSERSPRRDGQGPPQTLAKSQPRAQHGQINVLATTDPAERPRRSAMNLENQGAHIVHVHAQRKICAISCVLGCAACEYCAVDSPDKFERAANGNPRTPFCSVLSPGCRYVDIARICRRHWCTPTHKASHD